MCYHTKITHRNFAHFYTAPRDQDFCTRGSSLRFRKSFLLGHWRLRDCKSDDSAPPQYHQIRRHQCRRALSAGTHGKELPFQQHATRHLCAATCTLVTDQARPHVHQNTGTKERRVLTKHGFDFGAHDVCQSVVHVIDTCRLSCERPLATSMTIKNKKIEKKYTTP